MSEAGTNVLSLVLCPVATPFSLHQIMKVLVVYDISLVTIRGNELMILPGIALYSDNIIIIIKI